MINFEKINTEQRNQNTMQIDKLDTLDALKLINEEDKKVAAAVSEELPQIAKAVDAITQRIIDGGRLIYCGCGTSGRLGILDASECPPTFGTDPSLVIGLIAGGDEAFTKAVEGAEDDFELGKADLQKIQFSAKDALVGIAASGRTPYVLGAMEYAKGLGAVVISITCCKGSSIDTLADIGIAPMAGPEVVTGSTRLKSGTAQKMVLNMLSTTTMIKLGKVYQNLMVDVKATNEKLVERTISIVCTAADVDYDTAKKTLDLCGFSAKTAILMLLCDVDAKTAKNELDKTKGHISKAINDIRG